MRSPWRSRSSLCLTPAAKSPACCRALRRASAPPAVNMAARHRCHSVCPPLRMPHSTRSSVTPTKVRATGKTVAKTMLPPQKMPVSTQITVVSARPDAWARIHTSAPLRNTEATAASTTLLRSERRLNGWSGCSMARRISRTR